MDTRGRDRRDLFRALGEYPDWKRYVYIRNDWYPEEIRVPDLLSNYGARTGVGTV